MNAFRATQCQLYGMIVLLTCALSLPFALYAPEWMEPISVYTKFFVAYLGMVAGLAAGWGFGYEEARLEHLKR